MWDTIVVGSGNREEGDLSGDLHAVSDGYVGDELLIGNYRSVDRE